MTFAALSAGWRQLSANQRGILAMLAAMALFTGNDAMVKLATESMSPAQLMTIRGVFAVSFTLILIRATRIGRHLGELRQPIIFLRSLVEIGVAGTYISVIGYMALAEVISILQATPLILTALSAAILGERVGWRRWLAVSIGFCGVMLITQPSLSGINIFALLALVSAFFAAVRDLMTRRVRPHVPALIVAFASTIGSLMAGLVLSPFSTWVTPAPQTVALLAGAAFFLVLANLCIVTACRDVDLSVVAPFRFSVILWALLLGFIIWGDIPNAVAMMGIGLIMGAGVYTIRREAALRRESAVAREQSAELPPSAS